MTFMQRLLVACVMALVLSPMLVAVAEPPAAAASVASPPAGSLSAVEVRLSVIETRLGDMKDVAQSWLLPIVGLLMGLFLWVLRTAELRLRDEIRQIGGSIKESNGRIDGVIERVSRGEVRLAEHYVERGEFAGVVGGLDRRIDNMAAQS